MKALLTYLVVLVTLCGIETADAFTPLSPLTTSLASTTRSFSFMGDQERNKITRDSEPEEFFKTNTDKMTDEEKIPIAIVGVAGISLPFIVGLIYLYANK